VNKDKDAQLEPQIELNVVADKLRSASVVQAEMKESLELLQTALETNRLLIENATHRLEELIDKEEDKP